MKRSRMKRACAAAVFSLVVLAALTGGAGAAVGTELTVVLDDIDDIGSITAGKNIGYAASVANTGTSTVSHVSFVVDTAGGGTYLASQVTDPPAEAITCGQGPTASSMVCKTAQLAPGDGFTVSVAFSTSESASSLVATASATVAANTNGRPGNPGTSTWDSEPFPTELMAASGQLVRTFALPDDPVGAAGSGLTTALDLPSVFLHGHLRPGHGGKRVLEVTPLCDKCPTVFSGLSIPASLIELTNPFSASSILFDDPEAGARRPAAWLQVRGDLAPRRRVRVADWEPVPLCTSATDVVAWPDLPRRTCRRRTRRRA